MNGSGINGVTNEERNHSYSSPPPGVYGGHSNRRFRVRPDLEKQGVTIEEVSDILDSSFEWFYEVPPEETYEIHDVVAYPYTEGTGSTWVLEGSKDDVAEAYEKITGRNQSLESHLEKGQAAAD